MFLREVQGVTRHRVVTVAGTVFAAVLPVAAVTGDPLVTATAWFCLFPFCYLAVKCYQVMKQSTTRRNNP
jgi:hypothetical protein